MVHEDAARHKTGTAIGIEQIKKRDLIKQPGLPSDRARHAMAAQWHYGGVQKRILWHE